MFDEDDLLQLSALQHLVFCRRQWGLIHLEGIWAENRLTAEGNALHQRVDITNHEDQPDLRVARGLRLRSLRLGLSGRADVVEFHRRSAELGDSGGVALEGLLGLWQPFPVEYKRGRPKPGLCDKVQLCAQALCLEEMLQVAIPNGAIFYGLPRRRLAVALDADLRKKTEELCTLLHALTGAGVTPPPEYGKKCDNCSLVESCLPKIIGKQRKVQNYLATCSLTSWRDLDETAS